MAKNKVKVYKLSWIDLSGIGGPMGSESTSVKTTRYFTTQKQALLVANQMAFEWSNVKHITWKEESPGVLKSPDYGSFMIKVQRINVEE